MYVRRPPKSMACWAATGRRQAAPTLRRVDLQPPPQGDRDARTDRRRYPGRATLGRSIERLAGGLAAYLGRSEEHTSELQSHVNLVCRLLLEKKKKNMNRITHGKKIPTQCKLS